MQALAPWQEGVVVDGDKSWSTDKPVGRGGSKIFLFPVQRVSELCLCVLSAFTVWLYRPSAPHVWLQ